MGHQTHISKNKTDVSASEHIGQRKEATSKGQFLVDNRLSSLIQKKENNTGLPDALKSGMENLSGMSLDHVKVHRNSSKPAAVQAHAYAQGSDIHLAAGQEKHLPHELSHVVQQAQGRVQPTTSVNGVAVNDNEGLENEADVMGSKALQMKSEEGENIEVANYIVQKKSNKKQGFEVMDNQSNRGSNMVLQAMNTEVVQMGGGDKVEGHKHSNPYDSEEEKLKYDLFEKDWKDNESMKNKFLGMWKSKREEREVRVKERVESKVKAYNKRKDSFIKSDDLPLVSSYDKERTEPNHPYTGFKGKGEPVNYLSYDERSRYDAKLTNGKLVDSKVLTPHSEEGVGLDEAKNKKVIFTRRGSQEDMSAMIKESKDGDKKRTQHSTFNSGKEVANAGYLKFDDEGELSQVKLSSGHYAPDKTSGVKLRMWAEKYKKFDENTSIVDHKDNEVDTSEVARVEAVAKWNEKNPKREQDE